MEKPKNKARSLKLGKNDIICPSCKTVLYISKELKNDELIQCTKCEAAINNPLFFSGKFVTCQNCGNIAELPRDIKNELTIHCNVCNQDIYNPHSDKCHLITCPHCNTVTHVPDEILNELYLQCPNCKNDFKNTFRKKKNINIEKQEPIKSVPEQEITTNNSKTIIDETTTFTMQQKNWFIGIVIFVILVILMIGNYKPRSAYNDKKPAVEKKAEKHRSPEIIYIEIKSALASEFTGTCEVLFDEMQTDYPNSILFDSVKIIYDKAMNIVQLKKEEARKKSKINETNKNKEPRQVIQSKYLKVYAQAYSDGILSCNVYLTDKSGGIYYLDANSISYSIYDSYSNRIRPIGNSSQSNTNDGLFIDISLGTNVFKAKYISFIINTSQGVTYRSNNVSIDN